MAISSINPAATGDVWQMNQAPRQPMGGPQTAVLQTVAVTAPGSADHAADTGNDSAAGGTGSERDAELQRKQVQQALKDINHSFEMLSVGVQFELDSDYKDVIIKVVDRESNKVIRQIPSEEMVRFAKELDKLKGLLIEQTA